jgi:hypothetical protein
MLSAKPKGIERLPSRALADLLPSRVGYPVSARTLIDAP